MTDRLGYRLGYIAIDSGSLSSKTSSIYGVGATAASALTMGREMIEDSPPIDLSAVPATEQLIELALESGGECRWSIRDGIAFRDEAAEKFRYVIHCEVSGGVTGYRTALLKKNGEVIYFESRTDAEDEAARLQDVMAYQAASFRYTVEVVA